MNIEKLSQLSEIINQLKTIINTSGHGRFTKPQINEMRIKATELEQEFVDGVLNAVTEKNTRATILERTKEAKKEIVEVSKAPGAAVVVGSFGTPRLVTSDSQQLPEDSGTSVNINPVVVTKLESSVPAGLATELPSVVIDNDSASKILSDRLALEKKALVEKGKRKSKKTV